ncbi:hypothetical protein FRC17_002382 [Serendipita sp. 399]|nr:hypothetical protein FRC17_002382 [Serendipita sp. 399]
MAEKVVMPARISVQNLEPVRSPLTPEPSSLNHRPTKDFAMDALVRSAKLSSIVVVVDGAEVAAAVGREEKKRKRRKKAGRDPKGNSREFEDGKLNPTDIIIGKTHLNRRLKERKIKVVRLSRGDYARQGATTDARMPTSILDHIILIIPMLFVSGVAGVRRKHPPQQSDLKQWQNGDAEARLPSHTTADPQCFPPPMYVEAWAIETASRRL